MPFFEPVWYNRVLVNWPRAHSGVLQLTEASYLGPDSPRTSPRNETVKQCRRQMTVANSPVLWPSWTWCRIWWNHSWDSSRVTLNQRCLVFIRPCTHQVYRYYVISQTQSHSVAGGQIVAIGLGESRQTGITDGNTQVTYFDSSLASLTTSSRITVHRHHNNTAQRHHRLTAPVLFRGWLLSTRGGRGGARHSDSSRLRWHTTD